jgi:exosome complex RNA-binding protein Rrp4
LEDERLAMMAINKIEDESHTSGLTDRISQMFKKEKAKQKEELKNESKT